MNNLDKKWYVRTCSAGVKCWCRIITTNPRSDNLLDTIVPSGAMDRDTAKYIVKLHNTSINKL